MNYLIEVFFDPYPVFSGRLIQTGMFSIRFNYRKSAYEALIRVVKEGDSSEQYRITVMNDEIEMLLYGHHMLKEEDGKLDFSYHGIPQRVAELRTIITAVFETYQSEKGANAN